MLSIIPFGWRLLALAGLVVALIGFGWVKGAEHGEKRLEAYKKDVSDAYMAQAALAGEKSAGLLSDALILEKVKDDEIHAVNLRLADALERLRQRPERRIDVPQAAAACSGANGSDLSRPDAEFLIREAARADSLRAALSQCYDQYEKARAALDGF